MVGRDLALPPAVPAQDLDRKELGCDLCPLGDCPLREHVQVDLDAVRDDPAQPPDTQMNLSDFAGARRLRALDTVGKQVLGDAEFVHIKNLPAHRPARMGPQSVEHDHSTTYILAYFLRDGVEKLQCYKICENFSGVLVKFAQKDYNKYNRLFLLYQHAL